MHARGWEPGLVFSLRGVRWTVTHRVSPWRIYARREQDEAHRAFYIRELSRRFWKGTLAFESEPIPQLYDAFQDKTFLAAFPLKSTNDPFSRLSHAGLKPLRYNTHAARTFSTTPRHPLDLIELHHAVLTKVELCDTISGLTLGHPFLIVAVDTYSQQYLGYYWGLDSSSQVAAQILFEDIVILENYQRIMESAAHSYGFRSFPRHILVDDRGAVFRSEPFQSFCGTYQVRVLYEPRLRCRPLMERFLLRFNRCFGPIPESGAQRNVAHLSVHTSPPMFDLALHDFFQQEDQRQKPRF